MSENPCIGESLESFLRDEGIHGEVVAMAINRTLALQAAQTKSPTGLSGAPGAPLSHVIWAFPTGASSRAAKPTRDPFRSAGD